MEDRSGDGKKEGRRGDGTFLCRFILLRPNTQTLVVPMTVFLPGLILRKMAVTVNLN